MAKTLTTPQAPSSSKRGVLILAGVAVAAVLGAGSFFLGSLLNTRAPAAPAAPVVPAPIFVALDAFTVNLKGEDGDRFLHTGLSVKVADTQTQARIAEYLPEARSRILLLLSAKQPPGLSPVEGNHTPAEEIRRALATPSAPALPSHQIVDVLFPSFVVQYARPLPRFQTRYEADHPTLARRCAPRARPGRRACGASLIQSFIGAGH